MALDAMFCDGGRCACRGSRTTVWDERDRARPTQSTHSPERSRGRCDALRLAPLDCVLKPGERDQKERSKKVTEQKVDPEQREVKSSEPKSGPQRTKWGRVLHSASSFELVRNGRGNYTE